jgi:hypothetical protein
MTFKRLPRGDLCYMLLLEPTGQETDFGRIGLGGTGGGKTSRSWCWFNGAVKTRMRVV